MKWHKKGAQESEYFLKVTAILVHHRFTSCGTSLCQLFAIPMGWIHLFNYLFSSTALFKERKKERK